MSVGRKQVLAQTVLALAFFAAVLVGNFLQISPSTLAKWCLAAAATALMSLLTLDGLWLYRIKARDDRHLTVVGAIVVTGIVGVAFALAQWSITHILGLSLQREPVLALVSSVLGVTVIGVVVILLLNGSREELKRRNEILEQGIAVAVARHEVAEITQRMRMALDSDIDDALAPARRSIAEQLADQDQLLTNDGWTDIAQQLRAAAQETVRPLSRSLWMKTAGRSAPIRLGSIVRNIVTKQPMQPLALAVIYVVANFANVIAMLGWQRGLLAQVMGIALIFVITVPANTAMRRWPGDHAAIFIAATVLLQLAGLLAFPIRQVMGGTPYTLTEFAVSSVVGVLVVLLTSGAGSLRSHRADVARTFQSDIDRELIESVAASRHIAQLARESARVLHGAVQTRLIACAVAIERAADTRDVETFQSALHEAYSVLADPTRLDVDEDTALASEVARKVALWSGLCAITVDVEPATAQLSGRIARDVGRVVEEGLSNAIRHGGASAIRVNVHCSDEGIEVVVEDNGCGPQEVTPGLGSSLLDSLSDSWALTSVASGARLTVTLLAHS